MCIHVGLCMHVIFKWGFERYGRGNCPSWEEELSGGNSPGVNCSGGKCPFTIESVGYRPTAASMQDIGRIYNRSFAQKSPISYSLKMERNMSTAVEVCNDMSNLN